MREARQVLAEIAGLVSTKRSTEKQQQRPREQLEGFLSSPSTMMEDEDDEELEEETSDDFRERVAWQSKHEAKTCFGCGSSFNMISNRHHHCRACGRVVCGACSEHKDKVKGYASPQRTCDECHEKLAAQTDIVKICFALCPCLKIVKRQIKKQKKDQLLATGAVFASKKSGGIGSKLSAMLSGEEAAASRVRVRLRADGLALRVSSATNDAEEDHVYLHDAREVVTRGNFGLALVDGAGSVLFEGDLADANNRDAWVAALDHAIKEARAKPPPPKTDRPQSRVATAARRAKREIELQSKKRDAEKKKAEYMKGVGGGLKYTALAMADRAAMT
ncbi:hypothetical protein CTAYLR_008905 [Chrysophaeum taylorii]|uniref:FYVE-type domain-containing protein n=1 Tax=Chrysophaeum taylorii TaxID=2483200 RepID=A0AAD7XP93_9STRA|nr:hypothetical protein CTAYLR_008905 [Chrysophaeum taylorii]